MRRGLLASLSLWGAVLILACAKHASPPVLQAEDLSNQNDASFDPTEIVDPGSFSDDVGLGPDQVEMFLQLTPYDGISFLSTYQSNGVLAVDAIMQASTTYRINPLVFLVRAEMDQGLVAATTYPLPASRVEYVFGCGCESPGVCDPMQAGFDRQVDCLGAALRQYLDEIEQDKQTPGGWGPNLPNETLDGVSVTPVDESTAALYQYEPVVGLDTGGNWLFWNIWQLYANTIGYFEPMGGTSGTAQIGDACTSQSDCMDDGAICATGANYPGGMCTVACTGMCPDDAVMAFCADFQTAGYCLAVCNPMSPTPCRAGYDCIRVHQYKSADPSAAQSVCFAQ